MTAISTETDPAAPAAKGARGGILRLLGLVLGAGLCAAGGFGAGWFVYSGSVDPMTEALRLIDRGEAQSPTGDAGTGMQKVPRPLPEAAAFVTSYYTFPEALTTNPAGSRRFVQLTVSLSTQYDAKVMAHVETHKVALQSDMLAVIGSFTEEQMAGAEGRGQMAEALRAAINARLEALEGFGGIEGVFFPSFVVQ